MSQWRGRIEEIEEPGDLLPLIEQYYHIPTLVALVAFMFWTRVRDWENFVVGETVYFGGNDPWYHYRMVSYTVQNWPGTSPFDPWTYFPFGTHSSQFGTVYDQLMATAALVVGLGNPSDHTVRMVVLFTPAVLGTLTAIPVYYLGKRAAGRFGGVVAVGVLATFASTFVARGTAGFADHHIAEVFFQSVAVLTTMVAVSAAQQEKPVWELIQEREIGAIRRPVGWAVVAGAATAVYIWTWAPGVFLIGILGFYYLIELSSLQVHGESPEPVAIVGAVSMLTTTVLSLAVVEEIDIGATSYSVLQPGLALAVGAGCVFMAWLAREWDDRGIPDYQYPVAVTGILAVLASALAVVAPGTFDFMIDQFLRVVGLGVSDRAATIGEAQPLPFQDLYQRYRFTHFIALAGVGYIALRQFLSKARSDLVLLAVWAVFMLVATLTQRRFDYYFGITVAVMVGYTVATVADFGDLLGPVDDLETYQVVSIVAIVLVVFTPLVVTGSGVLALQVSSGGPGQSPQAWNNSLAWMEDSTPTEGNLEGAGNEMDFYGTFKATDDYDYESGFYGVLSWWDYGHWITVMGERIPIANPFQQGADQAANFLLSGSESEANGVLNELSDGNGTETRYVVADWKMATTERQFATGSGRPININGKYFAPFQFVSGEIDRTEYYEPMLYPIGQNQNSFRQFQRQKQPYYESTVVRLYHLHGSSLEAQPVVLDWEMQTLGSGPQARQVPVSQGVRSFPNMSAARQYVREDGSAQVGGVGRYPEERVPAMEHYRLVGTSDRSALDSRLYQIANRKISVGAFRQLFLNRTTGEPNPGVFDAIHTTEPNWVKVFERVPGGTIEGEGPANATVEASVQMRVPASNSSFTYRQRAQTDADGEFTMTVPYSTTGYDEYGPEEGYTNPEVRATSAYQIYQVTGNRQGLATNGSGYTYRYAGSTNVTEGQIIGEDDSPATVSLERQVLVEPPEPTNETSGDETGTGDESGSDTGGETSTSQDDGDQSTTSTPSGSTTTETPTESTPTSTAAQSVDGAPARDGQGTLGQLAALVGLPLAGAAALYRR
jgi:dolichyl-diphosphooligosaccharide--protein glycosyltransferase